MGRSKPTDQDRWRAAQVARAVHFVACLFRGVGKYETRQAATLAEARRLAAPMGDQYGRTAIVYAITPEGWTVPVD